MFYTIAAGFELTDAAGAMEEGASSGSAEAPSMQTVRTQPRRP